MLRKFKHFSLLYFILLISYIVVFPTKVLSQETMAEFWQRELTTRSIDTKTTSFCFIDRKGKLQGVNTDKVLPIASVSKIITSLASLRHYGSFNHRFKTTVSYSKKLNSIHIQASGDPTFNDEKIWFMLSKLSDLGFSDVQNITFNDQFYFMPNLYRSPQYEHRWVEGSITKIGPYVPLTTQTETYLKLYLNTEKYNTTLKQQLTDAANRNSHINAALEFSTQNIAYRNINPLSSADDLQNFEFSSIPLIQILKYVNSVSNNPIADIIFHGVGGTTAIIDSLRGILPADDLQSMAWFTGSGLPLTTIDANTSTREVNLLTCKGMLYIKEHFRHLADAMSFDSTFQMPRPMEVFSNGLLKILPVSGQEGTLASYHDLRNVFVGKTGTLRDVKLLTTYISATSGIRLLTMMGVAPSEKLSRLSDVYKLMLNKSITEFSGSRAFLYTPNLTTTANLSRMKQPKELADIINSMPNSSTKKILYLINSSDCNEQNCKLLVRNILKRDRNWQKISRDQDPLLMHAIVANKLFIVKELLAAKANPNQKIYQSSIPLFFLAAHQNLEMVKVVAQHPSTKLNLRNNQNHNILDYANIYVISDEIKEYLKTITLPN